MYFALHPGLVVAEASEEELGATTSSSSTMPWPGRMVRRLSSAAQAENICRASCLRPARQWVPALL